MAALFCTAAELATLATAYDGIVTSTITTAPTTDQEILDYANAIDLLRRLNAPALAAAQVIRIDAIV